MPMTKRLIVVLAILGIGGGAYFLGFQQGGERPKESVSAPPPAPEVPKTASPGPGSGTNPRAHPPGAGPDRSAAANHAVPYTHFRVGNSNVKAMLADGNLMWIGTSGGVIRYDTVTDQHRLFDVRSGLLSNGVFHLSKIGERLVVGTYGGGLSIFDPNKEVWENYNIQHGLADAFVYDVLRASNGDVWIATWSGANRVRGGALNQRDRWETFTVKNTGNGLPNDWVYGLREGTQGEIWMATEGGVARYHEGKWTHWQHKDGIGAPYAQVKEQIEFTRDPAKESSHHARQKAEQGLTGVDVAFNPNYIVSLEIDKDGSVWAGTWGAGLSHFDGKRWKNFTKPDGLPSNYVFLLRRDRAGRFWVGTSSGLALMTNGKFRVFTATDGLFADNVFSLAVSDQDSLWVGSYGGVSRFARIPETP